MIQRLQRESLGISKYVCMLAKLNMLCLTIKCSHTLVTIQLIHNMHAPI